jgi:hypothetical protein
MHKKKEAVAVQPARFRLVSRLFELVRSDAMALRSTAPTPGLIAMCGIAGILLPHAALPPKTKRCG